MGTDFGFDFNPTVDKIRVVSNTGQNLRLNPDDGSVTGVDLALTPGTASITGAAYTNNFAGSTTTVLFDIDSQSDRLYKQDPPNNGTLVEIGSLGYDVDEAGGFDIGPAGNALAAMTLKSTNRSALFTIDVTPEKLPKSGTSMPPSPG